MHDEEQKSKGNEKLSSRRTTGFQERVRPDNKRYIITEWRRNEFSMHC